MTNDIKIYDMKQKGVKKSAVICMLCEYPKTIRGPTLDQLSNMNQSSQTFEELKLYFYIMNVN